MNIKDKVKIKSNNILWNGLTGEIINIDDNTIEVKVSFEKDDKIKYIIQNFDIEELEKINESKVLIEDVKNIDQKVIPFLKYYTVMTDKEFLSILKQLDIENSDLNIIGLDEKINFGLIAKMDYIEKLWEEEVSELLVSDKGNVYSIPPQDFFKTGLKLTIENIETIEKILNITEVNNNIIKEDLLDIDFIKNYVYTTENDDIKPSWYYADRISKNEEVSIDYVIKTAKHLGYKVFLINKIKYVIAHKEINIDNIKNDFNDYNITINEV